ncbi:MAG: WbqC family protein [Candidatus Obscuribacterales bacterium]|nr:WbqC family protein [Candidatus Obscuribacterales bacterium]
MSETMTKPVKVAILQSSYIPWKGYFDQINSVDAFVLYDCVQFTRRDWRNRNKIKTPHGLHWLSIPVEVKGKYFQSIFDTKIADKSWAQEHFLSLKHHYAKANHFQDYEAELKEIYGEAAEIESLSKVNHLFLSRICKWLGINTPLRWADEFTLAEGKTERLFGICKSLNADIYISGPAAKDYLDEAVFNNNQMRVEWADYSGYPEYKQLHPPFEHGVTILDLLFNEGPQAQQYMKSFRA